MRLIGIAIIVTILWAPAALAKEVTKVTACGADDCLTTREPAILHGLMYGGPREEAPATEHPVIRLRATVSVSGQAVDHFTSWWVPASRLLGTEDGSTWMSLPPRAERALQRLARGLTGLPASSMRATRTPSSPPRAPAAQPAGSSKLGWLLAAGFAALVAAVVAAFRHRVGRKPFDAAAPG